MSKDDAPAQPPGCQIFGIRHHGPGSARSLLQALQDYQPDCVLIEGPPEANELIPFCQRENLKPPVSLLIYAPQQHEYAAYYPFAEFSPEWQAMCYATNESVPVSFIDLPISHDFALDAAARAEQEKIAEAELTEAEEDADVNDIDDEERTELAELSEESNEISKTGEAATDDTEIADDDYERLAQQQRLASLRYDPLSLMAEAAGYEDGERWWEHFVEERSTADSDVFTAIREVMTPLRAELDKLLAEEALAAQTENTEQDTTQSANHLIHYRDQQREAMREAWMRRQLRAAQKKHERVAVICGAWHVPALENPPKIKDDNALLKGLPKMKTVATWIPWTYGRLSQASGYRAGVSAPGWYHHLWQQHGRDTTHNSAAWLATIAAALREAGQDVSSAHIIEAVRLAEALAVMRGRRLAGLEELNEAVCAIMLFGDDLLMRMVEQQCAIGERMGQVPDDTPMTPLQQDLQRLQKSLRFKPSATQEWKTLDLRKPTDLQRSQLLRQLRLLDVAWGEGGERGAGKGTFKEEWRLQWQPELELKLIEASVLGHTVQEAARNKVLEFAADTSDLAALVEMAQEALYANLGSAVDVLMQRLQDAAALAADVLHLMVALPGLAQLLRYGDVRNTTTLDVERVVGSLVTRIGIGLPNACSALNEEAAAEMSMLVQSTHDAIRLLDNATWSEQWQYALSKLNQQENIPALLAGQSCRLLQQSGALDEEQVAQQFALALSAAVAPTDAAAWADGFLQGSGQILIYEENLWQIIDQWLSGLSHGHFQQVLPMLRRTFSSFEAPERRQMGERVKNKQVALVSSGSDDIDAERAILVLPVLQQILGLECEA